MLADVERRLEEEYARSSKKFAFAPHTNELSSTWNAAAMATDTELLVSLINSDILILLSNMLYNPSLQAFVRFYLAHRPHPTHDVVNGSALESLDTAVVKFYMFVLSIDAHKSLLSSLKLKVVDEKHAASLYASLLNRMPLMSIREVLQLCCILGDSNSSITQQIMEKLFTKRPASHAELLTYIHDIERIAVSCEQVLTALARPSHRSGGIKQAKLSSTALSVQWRDAANNLCDITYALSVLLLSCQNILSRLAICRDNGITSFGVIVITALCTCFDKIIPQLDAASASTTEDKQRIEYIKHLSRERCVMGLFALLHAAEYSDSNAMYVIDEEALATEVQRSQVFGWEEVLHMIVMGSEALVADVSKCFGQQFRDIVYHIYHGDEAQAQYYLDIVAAAAMTASTIDTRKVVPIRVQEQSPQTHTSASPVADVAEAVGSMKAIFPDYSDLFLRTCLEAFDMSVERAVDALFTENLPPSLQNMDRRAVSIWQGKAATDRSFVLTKHDGSKSEQQRAVELNKEKIRQLEKQAMEDSELLLSDVPPIPPPAVSVNNSAVEPSGSKISALFTNRHSVYADDYDDQYDDVMPVKVEFGESSIDREATTGYKVDLRAIDTSSEIIEKEDISDSRRKRKEKKFAKAEQKAKQQNMNNNWQQERDTILRLNKLLLDEEREDAYWKEMVNTNTPLERRQRYGDEELDEMCDQEEVEAKNDVPKPMPVSGNKSDSKSVKGKGKQSKLPEKTKAATMEGTDVKTKHRTKTYDKHHQKDKSLRKYGAM